jgi:hypothetical protein
MRKMRDIIGEWLSQPANKLIADMLIITVIIGILLMVMGIAGLYLAIKLLVP